MELKNLNQQCKYCYLCTLNKKMCDHCSGLNPCDSSLIINESNNKCKSCFALTISKDKCDYCGSINPLKSDDKKLFLKFKMIMLLNNKQITTKNIKFPLILPTNGKEIIFNNKFCPRFF